MRWERGGGGREWVGKRGWEWGWEFKRRALKDRAAAANESECEGKRLAAGSWLLGVGSPLDPPLER